MVPLSGGWPSIRYPVNRHPGPPICYPAICQSFLFIIEKQITGPILICTKIDHSLNVVINFHQKMHSCLIISTMAVLYTYTVPTFYHATVL